MEDQETIREVVKSIMTPQMDLQTIIVFDGIYILCVRLMYFAKTGTGFHAVYYRRNAEISTQIEACFFF